MQVAAVQYEPIWEDKSATHRVVERLLESASVASGTFVVLPELSDTGFSMNLPAIVDERSMAWASALAKRMGIYLQVGFARRGEDGKGRNCAAIVGPEVHPFSFGKEAPHYSGGEQLLMAACSEAWICPAICYDLRFPELWRLAALASPSAEVFTIGACWPIERQHHWRALVIARAIENQAYVVAVNRTGRDPSFVYGGGSLIVSPKGEVLAEAGDQRCVIQASLDLNALRQWRQQFPALRDAHREYLGDISIDQPSGMASRAG
jgi:omega-amidase